MQVEDFLKTSAIRFPDKIALICEGQRFSYADLDAQSNRLANALISLGLNRGDRVAIFMDNCVEAVVSIFGILKAGGVFLVVNSTTKADKLAFILNDAGSEILISHRRKRRTLLNCYNLAPILKTIILAGDDSGCEFEGLQVQNWNDIQQAEGTGSKGPQVRCIDLDLAALIYTSGSTGFPKGVMLTHANVVTAATSIITYIENIVDDIILSVLPLSFDYGLYQVLMAFKFGGTLALEHSFTYPKSIIDLIARERVTGFPIIPTISAILLQMDLSRFDLSSLRYITNTAAALPTAHILKLRQLLPHVRIISMYGLTECKRVSYLPPDQIDIRPESVGKAIPNSEVYIVDEVGMRVEPGIIGELVVRGSNVMRGYWNRPEDSDLILKPGPFPGERVLYTGDLFRMDDEGYLYFVGRKDDIIKTRGEKVSPREVENVICRLEGVVEAAVFGVDDDILGEVIKAVVRLKPQAELSESHILDHCTKNLENFMVPKWIEFRSDLPRTGSGKVDKKTLMGVEA